jgi:hypothetical protein
MSTDSGVEYIYLFIAKRQATVLRKVFGLKRDEVTMGYRKLHYEELYDMYSSPNIMQVIV